jgi:hypothetical protein
MTADLSRESDRLPITARGMIAGAGRGGGSGMKDLGGLLLKVLLAVAVLYLVFWLLRWLTH